jgi:hypothetical protein
MKLDVAKIQISAPARTRNSRASNLTTAPFT